MAITPTWEWPATGAVAPTAVQVKETVVATLLSAGAAESLALVHNMGLSAAELAAGHPIVTLERTLAAARAAQWIVSAKAADTVTLTQLGAGGATTNVRVTVQRPHSIGR